VHELLVELELARLELEPVGPPALGEIDGESIARLPMSVEVLPGALQVWGAGA